tara:strand:- start:15481 stop:15714 length:234 start_codon:yes stop_codon:yes gene_type:complete
MNLVEKIDATTHFVYAIPEHVGQPEKKIGVVNYPGSGQQPDKTKKHQACRNGGEIGHFGSVEEAANAILTDYRKTRK